jgi:hypothetical protein
VSEAAARQALSFEGKLMEITFWGAARAVTGSQHLIDVNGKRIFWIVVCSRAVARRPLNATVTCPSIPGVSTL